MIDDDGLLRALFGGAHAVTSTFRLARELRAQHDRARRAAGERAWETPVILPWPAWVVRCYGAAAGPEAPLLLGDLQNRLVWEQAIRAPSGGAEPLLLDRRGTIARAMQAWTLAHAWGQHEILQRPGRHAENDDIRAFRRWAQRYRAIVDRIGPHGAVDLAGAAQRLAQWAAAAPRRPGFVTDLVWCGIDPLTWQQRELAEAWVAAGARVEVHRPAPPDHAGGTRPPPALRRYGDPEAETDAAAAWARDGLLHDPQARIAIVVDDLPLRRTRLRRALAHALAPTQARAPAGIAQWPMRIEDPTPLGGLPLVRAALAACRLLCGPVAAPDALALLGSPHLAGGSREGLGRATVERRLAESGRQRIGLPELVRGCRAPLRGEAEASAPAPDLAARLEALAALAAGTRGRRVAAADAVAIVFDALRRIGWPGDDALDPAVDAAARRWRDALLEVAGLDVLLPPAPLADWLAVLARVAADETFQPPAGPAPVEVLPLHEAVGLRFDRVWLLGATEAALPASAEPNPFLPFGLQQELALPGASPLFRHQQACAQLSAWQASASELVASFARREGDRELAASPLVAGWRATDAGAGPAEPGPVPLLWDAGLELLSDRAGPALAGEWTGGTGALARQSICPFRAFAVDRLACRPWPEAGLEPDAADRGVLVHAVLARLWERLGTSAALAALDPPGRERLVEEAVDGVLALAPAARHLSSGARAVERVRLVARARAWLALEAGRSPFEVAAIEQRVVVEVAGRRLEVRPDRIDRLASGQTLVIDYKTSRRPPTEARWAGERPQDPQLPLYAASSGEAIAGVLFAWIGPGDPAFRGFTVEAGVVPGLDRRFEDTRAGAAAGGWQAQLQAWRQAIDRLVDELGRGEAAAVPRRPSDCRGCVAQPLCRWVEHRGGGGRSTQASAGEEDDDGGEHDGRDA